MGALSCSGMVRSILSSLEGIPVAGHNSALAKAKHGSFLVKYACSPSAKRARLKVALPMIVSRPLASKDSVELSGVRDTLKVVSLVRRNPGHGDGGPEEWNAVSALVYATNKDHDRDGSKESFILGKQSMPGDVALECRCGDHVRVLSDRRKVVISIRGGLEET